MVAPHSYSLVQNQRWADPDEFDDPARGGEGTYRLPPPPTALRGRVVAAAVALGAIAAAATTHFAPWHRTATNAADAPQATIVTLSSDESSLDVQPTIRVVNATAEVAQLAESQRFTSQENAGITFAKPADGTVVATFGGQYGTFHYGIEIAGGKDSPIFAAADGIIVAAEPINGFGLWIKEQLTDGTTLVYARMDDYTVRVGERVKAGQQIARMGNRGFGTTYTLHFEVWDPTNKKIDPEQWLNARGIIL